MFRPNLLTAIAIVAVASGCSAAINVSSHQGPRQDWSRYRTFEWAPPDLLPTVDPRLDANPVFNDRMHGVVSAGLVERGWTPAEPTRADVLIHYHANVSTRLDVARIDQAYGSCPGEACRGQTVEYEAGTLVLDFVDARTQRLIWRGWAQTELEELLRDPDRMSRTIDQAVTGMLRQLPSTVAPIRRTP